MPDSIALSIMTFKKNVFLQKQQSPTRDRRDNIAAFIPY